jgi:formylglycine-generating enzyme required for sulfatase activity
VALATLLAGLALFSGCDRHPPETGSASTPATASNRVSASASSPVASPQAAAQTAQASDLEMIRVEGGHFVMGDKDEVDAPLHEAAVGPFYIDKQLVSQEQFERTTGANPSRWKGPKNPVEQVRWSDAVTYCNKRSQVEGLEPCYNLKIWQCNFNASGYRLPTEAEWEFACRAGTATEYFFGDDPARLGEYAWFEKNAGGRPHPIGQKKANPWGLFDMCGNVWEWCNDFYQVDYYKDAPKQDPRGPATGKTKVVRGGAWRFSDENCRSGYRYNESPGYADVCFGYDIYGFRCVKTAKGR